MGALLSIPLQLRRDGFLPQALKGTPGVTPAGTDLAIYEYTVNAGIYAVAFQGNAGKPLGNYRFRSEAQRRQWVEQITTRRRSALERKATIAAERKTYRHDYKAGEILVSSWGYDQTNVEFYEVTATTERTVTLRPIAQASVDDPGEAPMTGKTTARPGEFIGEPETFRPTSAGGFKLNSYKWARRWDGKPAYFSTYA